MLEPRLPDVKTLFALSGNSCYYRGCEEKLTDPAWQRVKARIAHIRGEHPGSARYDAAMTDEERRSFDNLMLLCPNCHCLIDDLDPEGHTVDLLLEMKQQHEARAMDRKEWADAAALDRYATLALSPVEAGTVHATVSPANVDVVVQPATVATSADVATAVIRAAPQLVLRETPDHMLEIENVGEADAYGIGIEVHEGDPDDVLLADIPPGRMSPGAIWSAGQNIITFGRNTAPVVLVRWADASGNRLDASFPLQ